ncbi:ADP-dependent glucokinase-like [Petromyzon marinus]|uniref:ADP-dependent glucokinase-like n=1 Tax=Petromyzon marinus TaxID=7757 RepID=A0AAJ7TL08_PETMA|nr:ADP-dependent glucokinase-like [Petromyzon marinus]
MAYGLVTAGGFVAVVAVLGALWMPETWDAALRGPAAVRLDHVLSALLRAEARTSRPARPRVAIGFGGCLDWVVDGVALLERLGVEPSGKAEHHGFIADEQQLAQTFAYFFPHGAAAERFISNASLFRRLAEEAALVPGARWSLGGNAPVMANRMASEGCDVLLGARLPHSLLQVMRPEVRVAGQPVEEADTHLILEYPTGARWGNYTSKRANRFIVHSDTHNARLESLEAFHSELAAFQPALLVVGGLQMMDNFPFPPGERVRRLRAVRASMLAARSSSAGADGGDALVHFEMASFSDSSLLAELLDELLLPAADSLGMNEQELPNLRGLLAGGDVTLVADANPRVAAVLDQMREVYGAVRARQRRAGIGRLLTRLHVHTLAFQAIMTARNSTWKSGMSAAAKASLTANRHVCGSADIDAAKARLIMDDSFAASRGPESRRVAVDPNRPVACWEEEEMVDYDAGEADGGYDAQGEDDDEKRAGRGAGGRRGRTYELCVAPVLVCTDVFQTVGGGDNISAAGLVLQI